MPSESEQALYVRAQKEGISSHRVAARLRSTREDVANKYPNESNTWQQAYAEKLVWEHYFPGEHFPGKVVKEHSEDRSNEPTGASRLDRIFSNDTSFTRMVDESDDDGGRPWVHDKFSATAEHSDRKENRPSSRVSDYYPVASGRTDSYKPLGSSLRTNIDSYRPNQVDARSTPSPCKRRFSHSSWDNIPTGPAASRGPDQTLKEMVMNAGFGAKQYDTAQQLCHEQVKAKHSDRVLSSDWLKWKEESLIWRQFFDPKPFHFKEPSWASPSKVPGPRSGYEGNSPVNPVKASATATADEVDKRGVPGPTEYFTLEKRMETMVKARGGADLRRQFFQYLQKMRDRAIREHIDCDKSVRAFMADRLTWTKFFEEPFPGRKPLGGHSKACMRISDASDTTITTPTRSRQPLMTVTNQTRPVVQLPPTKAERKSPTPGQAFKIESSEPVSVQCPATSATVPKPVGLQPAESPTTARTFTDAPPQRDLPSVVRPLERLLIIQGNQISCSIQALKNISYSVVKDNKYELVGKALNCKFIIHQRAQDNGLRLTAVPLKADDTSAADRGAGFLQAWVGEVLERGPIEMSSYWLDFCTANGVPQNLVEGIRNAFSMYDKEAANGETSRGKSWVGSSETLACPEYQWEQYAEAFGASDVDRLVMEESAKAEGLLRMVYDEEAEELITLGEYKKRTLCRFVGMTNGEGTNTNEAGTNANGEGANGKRKADENDIEPKEKRVKIEADN